MAEIYLELLLFGLVLLLFEETYADSSCQYGCGYYTCTLTTCNDGCCGTYEDRYCCTGYISSATIVGAVIGGLVLLGIVIGVIAFCVLAVQKKKRRVQPRRVLPANHNNITVNNYSHRNHHRTGRPTATVPPYNPTAQATGALPYNQSTQPTGAPPFAVQALPPSYNDIYPQYNTNSTGHSNQNSLPYSVPPNQVTTNIQSSQQYGQMQIPNSPPPPY